MIWFSKKNPKGNLLLESNFSRSDLGSHSKERKFESTSGSLVLVTDDNLLIKSARLYAKTGNIVLNVFDQIHEYFRMQLEAQSHTLKKIQGQLAQKIEQVVDDPLLSGNYNYADQEKAISQKISADPKKAADIFLYLNKRIFELDAHMSSFQLLHMGEFIDLNMQRHNIRRLLLNIWHAFDDQFKKKGIRYEFTFEDSLAEDNRLRLDYKSINAAFYNFFDNIIKYALANSKIAFSYKIEEKNFELKIEMQSLIIEQDEIEKITLLGFRGKSTKDFEGSGVGMHVFEKALELNKLQTKILTSSLPIKVLGKDKYAKNVFIVSGEF